MIRLQKYIADAGIASRRKAEELITAGQISVNGSIVTELGTKVDEQDEVCFNGRLIKPKEKLLYIMLNKPEGCITSSSDDLGRKTVFDFISDIDCRLFSVGRLDYSTSGMLILTNDGDLSYKLTHPKHNIEKTYIARVSGIPDSAAVRKLESGVWIEENIKTMPAYAKIIEKGKDSAVLKIKIKEGRNRQVRKMCSAIGHEVISLKRISIGTLTLNGLKKGKYRFLTKSEVAYLKKI